jgi:G3E family GTPase
MEVTGGCFCCNFDDLNQRLAQLVEKHRPQVIFAESVGSCADVVATVVKPLLKLEIGAVKPSSFSVFSDIRLLRRFLLGQEMPFSEDVNYIFTQQIEEAGLLVINKIDLLPAHVVKQVLKLAKAFYPEKPLLIQNSLLDADIKEWVEALQEDRFPLPGQSLDLDYVRYARGEGKMVWLEREYRLCADDKEMPTILSKILSNWQKMITEQKWNSGHIKVILWTDETSLKLSLIQSGSSQSTDFSDLIKNIKTDRVEILLNVLIEGNLDQVSAIIEDGINFVLGNHKAKLELINQFDRRPGYPKPTYRILE